MDSSPESSVNAVELATELTIAWLSNPNTRTAAEDVPAFLSTMHKAVTDLSSDANVLESAESASSEYAPAVSVRKSLASKDHIISLIDGKPYKTLTRHLSTHGLTPVQYRERYGLKSDYPMTAPNYSEARRAMAKKIGLGRKPGESPKKANAAAGGEAPRRGRKAAPALAE